MKIAYQPATMSRATAIVELETPEEAALSESDLLLIVDNGSGVKYDQATGSYRLTGESFGAARHFGGTVEQLAAPNKKRVTVYID